MNIRRLYPKSELAVLKVSGADRKEKNENKKSEEGKRTGNNKSNNIALPMKNEKESRFSETLMKQKEGMQKRIATLQKRISALDKLIGQIPYEEKIVTDENGDEKLVKVYTEEDEKLLKSLEGQQEKITTDIKDLNEKMLTLDSDIKAALAEEQKRKLDKEKEKKEKSMEFQDKNRSKEEVEEEEAIKQSEFMIQSDILKKYVREGRITKAKLKGKEVRVKQELAQDTTRKLFLEQSARHFKDPINESPVPNTSLLNEKSRIESGNYRPDEKGGANKIKEIEDAIKRTDGYIYGSVGELNNELDKREEEQEENRKEKGILSKQSEKVTM